MIRACSSSPHWTSCATLLPLPSACVLARQASRPSHVCRFINCLLMTYRLFLPPQPRWSQSLRSHHFFELNSIWCASHLRCASLDCGFAHSHSRGKLDRVSGSCSRLWRCQCISAKQGPLQRSFQRFMQMNKPLAICKPGCDRGSCFLPGECNCDGNFSGELCNECAAGWTSADCTQGALIMFCV